MADVKWGDVFLLLPRVLLKKALANGRRAVCLDLPAIGHLLERVQVKGGGELSKAMLPIGGKPPQKGQRLNKS